MVQVKVYSAQWCGPCKMLAVALRSVDFKYEIIDIEEQGAIAEARGIRGVPTVIILDNEGNEKKRFVGFDKASIKRYEQELKC